MSTLRVSNIEAKADVSSPSIHEKIKVTNSEGDVLVHIDGATSGISTVGINTTVKTFDVDSNQNIDFVGNLTAPNITVTGTLSYEDVTNIDSVGVITARSDVSIADKIVHTGDTDTAIRFPGADQVSIETGGTQRLLIGSDGKLVHSTSGVETVDFGTSNSSGSYHKYDLGSSGATVGYIGAGSQIVSGSNVADFGIRSQANLVFSSGGDTERLRITSNGIVGIGTDSPDGQLTIRKKILATDAITTSASHLSLVSNLGGSNAHQSVIHFGPRNASTNTSPAAISAIASGNTASDLAFYVNTNNNYSATPNTEALRITSAGNIGINKTPSTKLDIKNGSDASVIVSIEGADSSSEYLGFGINSGEAVITAGGNGSTSNALVFRTAPSGTETERLRISSNGTTTVGPQYDQVKIEPGNGTYDGEATTLSVDGRTNDGNRIAFKVDRYLSGTSADTKFSINYAGLVNIGGAQFTANTTPSSGRGVEIFKSSNQEGHVQAFNRDSSSWDELRVKGSEVRLYANNGLKLSVQSDQTYLYGTSDGILNLDTTDARGSFIRFRENGSTKGWAGCSEGIGTGGDQDDFGIRAAGGFRVRTGSNNSIEINDEGQIKLRPLTAGFTTLGATNTYPGAAVSIQCYGVGAGTGTNIPQYGLYVDGAHSSNDATLMTGIYATAKQNTEGSAIGVHGIYYRDWNSYSKKIGGLFQAPVRAPRYATKSFNPGGGMFANTTSTGQSNALAAGGPQPDGTTPTSATYGDSTALWGDAFRSDTDTSNNHCDSIAIKATNRVTHGRNRTGLMIGIVDGNDTTYNRRKTQFVEYYANSTYQRYYRRNEIKDVTEHYPMSINSTTGAKNPLRSTHSAIYHYQHYVGYNQYSWYFFNTKGSTSARGGRINLDVTWTTGHAAGVGFGKYDILYRSLHSNSRVDVTDFVKYHEDNHNGSYYGWSSSPNVDVYESTLTGDSAGFYLRVQGHMNANGGTYDGYAIQSFRLVSLESDYNFTTECSFRFVGNSTPSDAESNPESRQSPNG